MQCAAAELGCRCRRPQRQLLKVRPARRRHLQRSAVAAVYHRRTSQPKVCGGDRPPLQKTSPLNNPLLQLLMLSFHQFLRQLVGSLVDILRSPGEMMINAQLCRAAEVIGN